MSDTKRAPQITLAQIYNELKGMGFDDPDQSIDGADFVEYGGKLFEDLGKMVIEEQNYFTRYFNALRATRDGLANWVEIQDDEDARQSDADAIALADVVLEGRPLPEPSMAERWVKLFNEWQDSELTSTYDFGDWLDKTHPGERETLTWIANWDSRPVDACLKADPHRATTFAVMDFGDGSIAIKRGFGNDLERRTWMVAS